MSYVDHWQKITLGDTIHRMLPRDCFLYHCGAHNGLCCAHGDVLDAQGAPGVLTVKVYIARCLTCATPGTAINAILALRDTA